MKKIFQIHRQELEEPSKQDYLIFLKDIPPFYWKDSASLPSVIGGLDTPRTPRPNKNMLQFNRQEQEEPSKQNYLVFLKDIE